MVLNTLADYEIPEELDEKLKEIRALLDKLDYEAVASLATKMLEG